MKKDMLHLESTEKFIPESNMPDCNETKTPMSMKKLKEKALFNRSGSLDVSQRRDSEDSNDSIRKPASLNEIQDLYAALHDLVKTNVTTTPIPERHHRVISPSASNSSSQSSPRANNSPKLSISDDRIYNNRRKQSREELRQDTPMKTKRGMSVGTLEIVSNLLKKSPFPTRKLSQEPEPSESEKPHQKVVRKTTRSRSEVNPKPIKNTLEKENNNKKWKLNIFKRMRSKSEATSSSTDDEYEDCSSDGDESMISEKSSVLEEDAEYNGEKSFISDSIRDIDQLVAALNLECPNQMINLAEKETSNYTINPENELSKLDNWYEKAAAEAVMYHSRQDLLESETDSNNKENRYNRRKSASAGGLRRPSTIKRGTSLGQKDKRRNKVSCHMEIPEPTQLVRGHAQSTPNLREHLNNTDSNISSNNNNKEITKMSIFTENNLKNIEEQDKKTHTRKVSLDDATRLPKSPLFYLPSDSSINETVNPINAKMDISLSLQYENGKQPSPRTIERMRQYKSLDIAPKKNNKEIEAENKKLKLKNSFIDNPFYQDEKSLWSSINDKKPDSIRNSLHLDTGIQTDDTGLKTDDNDNYCELNTQDESRPRNSSLQKDVLSILDDYIKENENKTKNMKFVVT